MPRIRLRVELFKGEELVDLTRLGTLPTELNSFLQSVGEDAGLMPEDNLWAATKFRDGSVVFSGVSRREVPANKVRSYERIAAGILAGQPDTARRSGASDRTLLKFVRFAGHVRSGESVRIGLFSSIRAHRPKHWFRIDPISAQGLAEALNPIAEYQGSILGIIHSLFKEGDKPHFRIRDIARDELVNCYYKPNVYGVVVKALVRPDSRVHVSGTIRANRVDKTIESVDVVDVRPAEEFSESDFESFFGCAPELTGDQSAEQYISKARENGA